VPRYPPCDSRLTIPVDHPQLVFRIFAGFSGFEDGFRPPLVFALYVFQLFVRQVLQPINALFALLTRMSSSSFT